MHVEQEKYPDLQRDLRQHLPSLEASLLSHMVVGALIPVCRGPVEAAGGQDAGS